MPPAHMAEQLAIWLALPEARRSTQSPRTHSRMARGPGGNQLAFWSVIHEVEDREDIAPPPPPPPPKPIAKPVRKSTKAPRACLGPCGKTFMSAGPGNRICQRCRRLDAYADGAVEYSVQF
jgi:hypothetical protein